MEPWDLSGAYVFMGVVQTLVQAPFMFSLLRRHARRWAMAKCGAGVHCGEVSIGMTDPVILALAEQNGDVKG